MKKYVRKLKEQAEEQPLIAAGIAVAALNGAVQLLKVLNERANTRTWAKEVERRRMMSLK